MDSEETIVVLISTMGIMAGVAVIWMAMQSRRQIREMEHRERLAMIEKGIVPAPEVDPGAFDRRFGAAPATQSPGAVRALDDRPGARVHVHVVVRGRRAGRRCWDRRCLCPGGRRLLRQLALDEPCGPLSASHAEPHRKAGGQTAVRECISLHSVSAFAHGNHCRASENVCFWPEFERDTWHGGCFLLGVGTLQGSRLPLRLSS